MLSKKEIKAFVQLAGKIKNPEQGLPEEIFDVLVKIATTAACEMVIVNSKKEILLTWRNDKFWIGWHFPGGLLRYNESFSSRLKKTAQKELGCNLVWFKFLLPMNYVNGARGHDVSFVFLCKLAGKPKDGKWFKVMPKDIIPEHKRLWQELKKIKIL